MEDVGMGFFSDLKEDLSQAVNELMPEEELDAVKAGSPETESVVSAEQYVQDATVTEEVPETVNSLDISSMLDKLDEMDTVEETEQEAAAIPEVTEETTEGTSWTDFYAMAENGSEPEDAEIPEETVTEETVMEEEEPLPAVEEEASATEETEMEADNILSQPEEEEEKTMDVQINRVAVDETAVVSRSKRSPVPAAHDKRLKARPLVSPTGPGYSGCVQSIPGRSASNGYGFRPPQLLSLRIPPPHSWRHDKATVPTDRD